MMNQADNSNQAGFTILELLIATVVFSVLLLVVTTGIIQFTRVYFKGITESNTQTAARNIIDNISQAIQFNGGKVNPSLTSGGGGSLGICIGGQRYSYVLGKELVDGPASGNQANHVLILDQGADCNGATAQDLSSGGTLVAGSQELLSPNMRLAQLNVSQVGTDLYKIDVKVAYGDDDLLNNPTASNATCLGQAGSQFCAVSDLSTVVQKRIKSS